MEYISNNPIWEQLKKEQASQPINFRIKGEQAKRELGDLRVVDNSPAQQSANNELIRRVNQYEGKH